jgi:tetratricopeptide (TPR) repeat protein
VGEFQTAIELAQGLVCDDPSNADFRYGLTANQGQLATQLRDTGHSKEAQEAYGKTIDEFESLVRDYPDDERARNGLAGTYNNLGRLLHEFGRLDEALRCFKRSIELREALARENPAVARYPIDLAGAYNNLGVLLKRGYRDFDGAKRAYQRAIELSESVARDHPGIVLYRSRFAANHGSLGTLLLDTDHPGDALPELHKSVEIFKDLALQNPDDLEIRSNLGATLYNQGAAQFKLGRLEESRSSLLQAIAHHRMAFDGSPRNIIYWGRLNGAYSGLAELERSLGLPAAAAATALERQRLCDSDAAQRNKATELYKVACELALCVPLVGGGKDELSDGERAERLEYSDRAFEALRRAIASGYRDVVSLRTDQDLNPLRSRSDFRALVLELLDRMFPADEFPPSRGNP